MDKIEDASAALDSAAASYDARTRAVVMIRLSESTVLENYARWAQTYVDRADVHLSGILLFHTAVAQDLEKDATSIVTSVKAAWRKGVPAPGMTIKLASSLVSSNQTKLVLVIDGSQVSLERHHSYTNAELFALTTADLRDSAAAVVRQSPGQTVHLGLRLADGKEVFLPRDPIPTSLTLFS